MRKGIFIVLTRATSFYFYLLLFLSAKAFNNNDCFVLYEGYVNVKHSDFPGDFFDECGHYLGNDGKADGKLYVIKTTKRGFENRGFVRGAGISDSVAFDAKLFVRKYSGQERIFNSNRYVYNNFQEIISSDEIRLAMFVIVSKDNGVIDTSGKNNREYGGAVDINGKVQEAAAGKIKVSCDQEKTTIKIDTDSNTQYEFHSHPSGFLKKGIHTAEICYSHQPPSTDDIRVIENRIGYVFGMLDRTVYIYNNEGVLATIPIQHFVNLREQVKSQGYENITR